jgi:hypothetical protein
MGAPARDHRQADNWRGTLVAQTIRLREASESLIRNKSRPPPSHPRFGGGCSALGLANSANLSPEGRSNSPQNCPDNDPREPDPCAVFNETFRDFLTMRVSGCANPAYIMTSATMANDHN